MKIKQALQGCSARGKLRSRSPFSSSSGSRSSDETTEILDTNLNDEAWGKNPWAPKSADGLEDKEREGNEKKPIIKTAKKDAYDMRSNVSKQVSWKDVKVEKKPEKKLVDEQHDVNKHLETENTLLRKDVHRVEERVKQLEKFLEECNKAKAQPTGDSLPTKDSKGEYLRVRNENVSMSETMKVLAKLVQRQEQSLQRHRQQAIAHQTELRDRRRFIHELERELDEKQKDLHEISKKDLEHQLRVKSIQRQFRFSGDEARKDTSEHDFGVRKILLGIHPHSYRELPSIEHSYGSSSSSASVSEQNQTVDESFSQYSTDELDQTLQGVKELKLKLEVERLYLLNERELMKRTDSDTEYSTESDENLVLFESRSTCSASEVTFDG